MKDLLKNWVNNLDTQIVDTEEKINTRRKNKANAISVRNDITAILSYLDDHDLPDDVRRGIEACLKWNPFCRE